MVSGELPYEKRAPISHSHKMVLIACITCKLCLFVDLATLIQWPCRAKMKQNISLPSSSASGSGSGTASATSATSATSASSSVASSASQFRYETIVFHVWIEQYFLVINLTINNSFLKSRSIRVKLNKAQKWEDNGSSWKWLIFVYVNYPCHHLLIMNWGFIE